MQQNQNKISEEIPVTQNRIEYLCSLDSLSGHSIIFGNGNEETGRFLLNRLALKIQRERKNNPVFAEGPYHALGKIEERMKEFSDAVLKHDFRQKANAYLLIAALVRFLNEEHLPEVSLE